MTLKQLNIIIRNSNLNQNLERIKFSVKKEEIFVFDLETKVRVDHE